MKASSSSNTPMNLWQEIRRNFSSIQPVWPFFGLLTLAMAVMYGLTVANLPAIRQPWVLVGFTLMMLAHTALHWLSPVAAATPKRSTIYLVVQIALVLSIIALTHYEMLIYGLFIGLIGESLGLIRPLWRSFVMIFVLTAAMFLVRGWFFSWAGIIPFIITIIPLTFFVVIYVYLFTRQLEEKERAEDLLEDLEIAHQQLSEYAARIEQLTLTNERQRMARELHDTLTQGLAGVILQLEAAEDHLQKGNSERAQTILGQSITRARSTLADARQVIDDLRMMVTTETNLREILKVEAGHLDSLLGLRCEVDCPDSILLGEDVAAQVEKIVSEGLTNIARHARAKQCWVKVSLDPERLSLEIGDDGKGFDAERSSDAGHYGLVGMKERVSLLGGNFHITSVLDQGTRLLIELPAAVVEGDAR